jgi:hypothetical protein
MKCIKVILDPIDSENQSAIGLVDRMNKLPEYCSIHPDFETVLIVSSASKTGIVRVQSICCKDFQNRLVQKGLISQ